MSAAKKKALVVDDEKSLAKALMLKLNNAGFDAVVAHNGKEALAALEKDSFDLILLDLVMPVLDGFGVLEKLKEIKNKIPVIVLSNLSQPDDEQKSKALGASDFFIKSDVPISEIVEKVIKKFH